jgi:Arc/MetJ-type ribon-helix-helix transcriptional regulator
MVKDTVRYPDAVVEQIEQLVEETPLESKSEFYRFSAELTLSLVDGEYAPEMFHFEDLQEELGVELTPDEPTATGESALLEALITVRKHCLRGDFDGAEAYIDENFVDIDRETMVLEEVLTLYRNRYTDDD